MFLFVDLFAAVVCDALVGGILLFIPVHQCQRTRNIVSLGRNLQKLVRVMWSKKLS